MNVLKKLLIIPFLVVSAQIIPKDVPIVESRPAERTAAETAARDQAKAKAQEAQKKQQQSQQQSMTQAEQKQAEGAAASESSGQQSATTAVTSAQKTSDSAETSVQEAASKQIENKNNPVQRPPNKAVDANKPGDNTQMINETKSIMPTDNKKINADKGKGVNDQPINEISRPSTADGQSVQAGYTPAQKVASEKQAPQEQTALVEKILAGIRDVFNKLKVTFGGAEQQKITGELESIVGTKKEASAKQTQQSVDNLAKDLAQAFPNEFQSLSSGIDSLSKSKDSSSYFKSLESVATDLIILKDLLKDSSSIDTVTKEAGVKEIDQILQDMGLSSVWLGKLQAQVHAIRNK